MRRRLLACFVRDHGGVWLTALQRTKEDTVPDKKGLTKPLKNNVGGVVDQDAPSADQLLKGQDDPAWDKVTVEDVGGGYHEVDESGTKPGLIGRDGGPLGGGTDRRNQKGVR
jgi:hypothetical protein